MQPRLGRSLEHDQGARLFSPTVQSEGPRMQSIFSIWRWKVLSPNFESQLNTKQRLVLTEREVPSSQPRHSHSLWFLQRPTPRPCFAGRFFLALTKPLFYFGWVCGTRRRSLLSKKQIRHKHFNLFSTISWDSPRFLLKIPFLLLQEVQARRNILCQNLFRKENTSGQIREIIHQNKKNSGNSSVAAWHLK